MNRSIFHGLSWLLGYMMASAQAGLLGWHWVWFAVLLLLIDAAKKIKEAGK